MFFDCGFGIIEVWVECNQKRLSEHAQKEGTGTEPKECHIASQEDQEFRVCAAPTGDLAEMHSVNVYLDGKWLAGQIFNISSRNRKMHLEGVWITDSQLKPFVFGKLALIEDNGSEAMDPQALMDLGTIRVKVTAVTTRPGSSSIQTHSVTLPSDNPISEKAKKGGAHVVRLGSPRTVEPIGWAKATRIPGSEHRFGIFHYAPIELLYAREIIERPLSPVQDLLPATSVSLLHAVPPVKTEETGQVAGKKRTSGQAELGVTSSEDETEGPLSSLTPEERESFIRIKQKLAQSRLTKVKKEKKVKREPVSLLSNEVICLSD